MTIPTWPATLSPFLRGTVSVSEPDGRLHSSTDMGPGKVRRRSKANAYALQGDMVLTPAQRTTLRSFIETDTLGGSLPFSMPDPFDSETTLLCRFGEELPVFSDFAVNHFKTTISLVVLP